MNGCAEFMKTTKIKFKIGEFSKPNRITVKTLRHYEKIGPPGPEQADKRTGYPYYGACQLGRMNTIRHLKGRASRFRFQQSGSPPPYPFGPP